MIIASILAAFAIDAWWEERQERQRETAYLIQLEVELLRTREDAEGALASENDFRAWSDELQAALYTPTQASREQIAFWFDRHLRSSNFDPDDATIVALVNSGDISLVESVDLRLDLARYTRAIHDVRQDYDRFNEAALDALASLNRRVDRAGIRAEMNGEVPYSALIDWEAVAADPVVRGDLQTIRISLSARRRALEEVLEHLAPVLDAIRAELDAREVEH